MPRIEMMQPRRTYMMRIALEPQQRVDLVQHPVSDSWRSGTETSAAQRWLDDRLTHFLTFLAVLPPSIEWKPSLADGTGHVVLCVGARPQYDATVAFLRTLYQRAAAGATVAPPDRILVPYHQNATLYYDAQPRDPAIVVEMEWTCGRGVE